MGLVKNPSEFTPHSFNKFIIWNPRAKYERPYYRTLSKNYILQEAGPGKTEYEPCLLRASVTLIDEGTNQDAKTAVAVRELWKSRRRTHVCRSATPLVTWGDAIQRIDYAACEISFGGIHFVAIDMGI